jgi:hypothetical protein
VGGCRETSGSVPYARLTPLGGITSAAVFHYFHTERGAALTGRPLVAYVSEMSGAVSVRHAPVEQ